jgi:hypothetical protein
MISVPEQAEMEVDIACRTVLAQRGVNFPMRKYGRPPLIDLTDCKDIIIVDRNYLIDHISSIYRWAQSQEG